MNWLDVILGIIIVSSLMSGVRKGMIRMGIGLVAMVLALVLAFWTYNNAGAFFADWTSTPMVANLLGFFLVFFGTMIAGSILSMVLTRIFKWMGLSWLDRILGGLFGGIRGAIIATIVLMAFTALAPGNPPKLVGESMVAPYLMDFAEVISSIAPTELRSKFLDAYGKVKKEYWDPVQKTLGNRKLEKVQQ